MVAVVIWQFREIRGPDIDPMYYNPYCSDLQERTPKLRKHPYVQEPNVPKLIATTSPSRVGSGLGITSEIKQASDICGSYMGTQQTGTPLH